MASDDYNDQYWRDALGESPARDFKHQIFACRSAMVKKKPVNGHRMWTEFDPTTFSDAEYDIVPGMWDHEHCCVCWDSIKQNDSYFENSQKRILCPNCYEAFTKNS